MATLALLNVKRCQFSHDACRKTVQFPYAGQNLAISQSMGYPVEALSIAVPKFIKDWYSEVAAALQSDITAYPKSTTRVIGHFTQVVKDRATHVGCAIARYTDASGWDTVLLACDYARTNMIGEATYLAGPVASKCTTGVNPNFKALCSVKEVIAP